jgi:hypothetical protein
MVDIEARRKAAELIDRFRRGEITNYQYEDAYPQSQDPALWAIQQQIWFFYSDVRKHRLTGKNALNARGLLLFDRSTRFLNTDLEYSYPPNKWDLLLPVKNLWHMLTFKPRPAVEPFPDFWPFESQEQLDQYRLKV